MTSHLRSESDLSADVDWMFQASAPAQQWVTSDAGLRAAISAVSGEQQAVFHHQITEL